MKTESQSWQPMPCTAQYLVLRKDSVFGVEVPVAVNYRTINTGGMVSR
jgi:hypothetical protein